MSSDIINIRKDKLARKRFENKKLQLYIFVVFAAFIPFCGYLLFNLYPNVLSVVYSFFDWNGISKMKFVGLDNYKMLINDPFLWRSLYHNLLILLIVPVSIVFISVILADFLTARVFKENNFYKVLYFVPNVLPFAVVGLIWSFIYDGNTGLLNGILKIIGIKIGDMYWLGDERTALYAVMATMVWCGTGFYIIIFMNAMSAIPKSLYESAYLDGITNTARLFKITLPLIMSVIRVSALFIVLWTFKGFEIILLMTGGGPGGATDVVGLYMYGTAFGSFQGTTVTRNYGYASTIGMLLFVILVGAKLVVDKYFRNETVEY